MPQLGTAQTFGQEPDEDTQAPEQEGKPQVFQKGEIGTEDSFYFQRQSSRSTPGVATGLVYNSFGHRLG